MEGGGQAIGETAAEMLSTRGERRMQRGLSCREKRAVGNKEGRDHLFLEKQERGEGVVTRRKKAWGGANSKVEPQ